MRYTLINQNDEVAFTCRSINLVALSTTGSRKNGGGAVVSPRS
jgi:hypothetical protein